MPFQLPSPDELKNLAADLGQPLDDAGAGLLAQWMQPFREGYRYLESQPDDLPPVRYPQRSFHFPAPAENPLGAWYVQTQLAGRPGGLLDGKRVAVKDNIFVAGVPMANGAPLLQGFRPDFDATVVSRLLDAGAAIAGKSVCEYLCLSGGSSTASTGFVRNPRNPAYSAGGSSSGSAALVAGGTVDLALACDQAGSIRIPASWCGAVGLKPTHGLVPYTGILGMEASCDHVGPITANVADNALMLEVLAGADGLDGRQGQLQLHPYTRSLGASVAGMKIGVVTEAIGTPPCTAAVAEAVRAAAGHLARLGATVRDVSIPMHLPGIAIWSGVLLEGLWQSLRASGVMHHVAGVYSPAYIHAMQGWTARLKDPPINVLMTLLFGRYLERYAGQYYARARNLVPRLRRAYDQALAEYDLLLLPTTPVQASRLPESPAALTPTHILTDVFSTSVNTCQFDVTGHPAISIPCASHDGLPVGMMLVARHFAEPALYRAAHAFEQSTAGGGHGT
jgi:amidase